MLITKIIPAVKTSGRYNIFLDGEYSFSLTETQLVELGLKSGQKIDDEKLLEYKSESGFGKNYVRAIDLISRRLRSEREIRDYALRKQWSNANTERVIERLYKFNYLDDKRFAESFVRSRASGRLFSKRKMILELMKKGIKRDVIDTVLSALTEYNELDSLRKLVIKKRDKYDDKRKLVAYLSRQGFNYDDIVDALDNSEHD